MICKLSEILDWERKIDLERYEKDVLDIIQDVKERGDESLIELTKKFDRVELEELLVTNEEFDEARELIEPDELKALEKARENIEFYHRNQIKKRKWSYERDGIILGRIVKPIESVGLYVPGGRASYPSTALMAAIPAKIAGVRHIIACTPPSSDGRANPYVLTALSLCGVKKVAKVGGAQAVAAMAFGTESIPSVRKIVGPGNIYVTVAKMLLQNHVSIDFPAGPSEILIIADETANPRFLAIDMLAQLEHDPLAIAVLLCTSMNMAKKVEKEIRKHVFPIDRWKIAVVRTVEEGIEVANKFAPEHLTLAVENPKSFLEMVENAGSVFLGHYSPVAAGDYMTGTNHILPTSGYASLYSGLGVDHFIKFISYQLISREALEMMGEDIMTLAEIEGLKFHGYSVKERLE
jgi:histidinol dehydrogenase